MDKTTLELIEDYAKRNGVSFERVVDNNDLNELLSIAENEYAQQQCDDARTSK